MPDYPSETNRFLHKKDLNELDEENLREFLAALQDGTMIRCRGRDNTSDEWDYGVATKTSNRLYIQYVSADTESLSIQSFLPSLVEFVYDALAAPISTPATPEKGVIVLSHGWSPSVGPNYPLINELMRLGISHGWHVVVPNFKAQIHSYTSNQQRSRAERIKVIYEELLCLDSIRSTLPIVLVGHSQGAASAMACTDRLCSARKICGLLMLGSENPQHLDKMKWVPKATHIKIVHATGDHVIGIEPLRKCAADWNCEFKELTSQDATPGSTDRWGDDMNHDFLAKDLMKAVKVEFSDFIQKCANVTGAGCASLQS